MHLLFNKNSRRFRCLVLLYSLVVFATVHSAQATASDPTTAVIVEVTKHGERISIDVDFQAAVAPQQAWEVLTDFDHMRDFISSLQSSQIIARDGMRWQVAQKGAARRGPLNFGFDSVREIELAPFDRITSRQVSGSMKKFEAVTRLSAQGTGTRIQYHADSVPGTFIPPIVGIAFIETETRRQFTEMLTEMSRRSAKNARINN